MVKTFTVAIRVFNSTSRIDALFKALEQLQQPFPDSCLEFLFIDNGSGDGTVDKILSSTDRLPVQTRVLVEPKPGSVFARVRGVIAARTDYVAFLDDDNLPRPDWLRQVDEVLQTKSDVSVISGKIHALDRTKIPDYVLPYLPFYAVIDRGDREFYYNEHPQRVLPPGAGLILNRCDTLTTWAESPPRVLGPTAGGFHLKGEDIELLRKMEGKGYRILYRPTIVIDHDLTEQRFQVEYLKQFLKGTARSRHYHRMLAWTPQAAIWMTFLYGVSDVGKLLLHLVQYRPTLAWQLKFILLLYIAISPAFTLIILATDNSDWLKAELEGAFSSPQETSVCNNLP